MSTIFLARKLLSFKHSNIALEKIQHLKKRNIREMTATKRELERLITKYKVLNNCRLCLRPAEINMFTNEAGINYAEDVKSILDIDVKHNDGRPQYICDKCVTTVRTAVELKQIAAIAQWRLHQEELASESVSEDNTLDVTNQDKEDIVIYHIDAPKCEQCGRAQGPNVDNDCKQCHENSKKARNENFGHAPFVCETCGLKVKNRSRLRTHLQTHSNEFNFSCGYCQFRTRNKNSLQVHERSHTGERPYRCVQCGAAFTSCSSLASHRRTHQPPRYGCAECDNQFKFKHALLHHIATHHRTAKPFYCSDCGNSYATRKLYRRHERRIHNRPKIRQGLPCYIQAQEDIDEESQDET